MLQGLVLLKVWVLQGCCSSAACPTPLLGTTAGLGEAMDAGLGDNGAVSGKERDKVAPCEL